MNNIYREEILSHFEKPRNFSVPAKFTHTSGSYNPACGDNLTAYLTVRDGRVEKINFQGTGCAISIAAASILSDRLAGKKKSEILSLTAKNILDILKLELTPTRLKCALLPIETIQNSLNK